MGMEGRYLAMRRGVVPVSVSTTIILASTSKAVLTAETQEEGQGDGGSGVESEERIEGRDGGVFL